VRFPDCAAGGLARCVATALLVWAALLLVAGNCSLFLGIPAGGRGDPDRNRASALRYLARALAGLGAICAGMPWYRRWKKRDSHSSKAPIAGVFGMDMSFVCLREH